MRVLLLDPVRMELELLKALLENQNGVSVVGHFVESKELFFLLDKEKVDVILADFCAFGSKGMDIALSLYRTYPLIPTLCYSAHVQPSFLNQLKRFGVKGYISKDKNIHELLEAMEEISEGLLCYPSELKAQNKGDEKFLTVREIEIIRLIREGNTSASIAKILQLSEKSIDAHRASIFKKAKVKNVMELLQYAIENHIVTH